MAFLEDIAAESDQAFERRTPWLPLLQDCADLFMPSMSDFLIQTTVGQRKDRAIIDAHGVIANRRFARAINAFLTPEGFPWLGLRVVDEEIGEIEDVKTWVQDLARIMLEWFHSPASGFYGMSEETYSQLGAFGTGPLFIGETSQGLPYFQAIYLGEITFAFDERGNPVAAYRRYKKTALDLKKQFGENGLPDVVKQAIRKEPGLKFDCEHVVRGRRPGDPISLVDHPWLSVYRLRDPSRLLRPPGGYHEFPYLGPRWNRSPNEDYGRGPAMDALGDCKSLQKVARDTMRGIHKSVDPNIIVADDGTVSPRLNQNPGGIWYAHQNHNGKFSVQQVPFAGNVSHGTAYQGELRGKIDQHFFRDAFELPPQTSADGAVFHQSATEFAGRQRQQLQFAGPLLARLRSEMLFPLVTRSYNILDRAGVIPERPPEMEGTRIVPEYVSPLAMALLSHESDTIMQFLGKVAQIAQVDPRVMMRINPRRTVDALADADRVPREILTTDEEFQALEQQQEDEKNLALQVEAANTSADTSLKGAQALQLLEGGAA